MKRFALVAIILLFATVVCAQEAKITSYYAGALYTGSYNKELSLSHDINIRGAGEMTIVLNDATDIFFRGAYVVGGKSFGQFWLREKYKDFQFDVGFLGRPVGFLNRPSPIGNGAQFEPPGTAVIPGSGTGVVLSQKMDNLSLYGSAYYAPDIEKADYNLGAKYNFGDFSLSVCGFYNPENHGIASTLKSESTTVTVFESKDLRSCFLEIPFGNFGSPFFTAVYDKGEEKLSSAEIGWTKGFDLRDSYNNLKGLVGCGYITTDEVFNIYFWLYL